jgi:hypothetical protein
MAVACSEPVAVQAGSFRADDLAALVPAGAWQRLGCTDGSKGHSVAVVLARQSPIAS